MATDITQPPRFCPECGHKSGSGPCGTCKPYGAQCTWCLHSGPVPTDITIVPTPTEFATLTDVFVASNAAIVAEHGGASIGEFRGWKVYHDWKRFELRKLTGEPDGDPRLVFENHGLGRKERDAIIPKLVAAIEGVIEQSEGG